MDAKKIGITGVVLVVALAGITVFGQYKTEQNVERLLNENSLNNTVQYDSVSFNPFTLTPSINDVVFNLDSRTKVEFETLSIHSYALDTKTKQADIDVSYRLKKVPVNEAPRDIRKALLVPTMLGLSNFASEGRVSVDANGEELSVALAIAVNEIATVDFNLAAEYDLSGVDMSQGLGNLWLAAMFGGNSIIDKILIDSVNFELHDDGLLPQIADEVKKSEGYEPSKQLDELTQLVAQSGLAKLGSSEAKDIASELDDFIASPNELNISVNPDTPISFEKIKDAIRSKQVYERLGMSISS